MRERNEPSARCFFRGPPEYRGDSRQGRFIRGFPGNGPPDYADQIGGKKPSIEARSRRQGSSRSPRSCAKHLGTGWNRGARGGNGKGTGRGGEGRSSARWLYGMSWLCLARVRNVIHTPSAFRRVPRRSRRAFCCGPRCVPRARWSPLTSTAHESGTTFPTYVRGPGSTRRRHVSRALG